MINFLISEVVYSPTSLSGEYPYFVCGISKADDTAITPKELVALNVSITSSDYSKVPIISGSGYVGAGVTVRRCSSNRTEIRKALSRC